MNTGDLIGQRETQWLLASDDVDMLMKGHIAASVDGGKFTENQLRWIEDLKKADALELRFNKTFFTHGDSREPEQAGVWGAVMGSLFTLASPWCCRSPSASRPRSTSRSTRARTAGRT